MLDFVIPTSPANIRLVPDCLRSIEEFTDVPMTIKVIVDGGDAAKLDTVRASMNGLPKHIEWRLLHESPAVGQIELINRALKTPKQPFTVLMPPQVRLDDRKWISKFKQVFDRDPGAALVDLNPHSSNTTAHPIRRARKMPPVDTTMCIVKTRFAVANPLVACEESAVKQWFERAFATGHNCWFHPAVRFITVEHQEHDLCKKSASPSQTTRR